MTVTISGNPRTISNLNCLFSMHNWKWVNLSKMAGFNISLSLKGQCPDYAHARASSVFSSKDNRTVILTRQDFLSDRTADGDLLFIFSSNILDFRRSLSSYIKIWLAVRRLIAILSLDSSAALRPENLAPLALKTYFLIWNSCQRSIVTRLVISAWFARVLASNVWKT